MRINNYKISSQNKIQKSFLKNTDTIIEQEIEKELRFVNNSRTVSFRYDLLNKNDIKIAELESVSGSISYDSYRQIKRTASFSLSEYEQKEINYFSDRIQPWFILHMPNGETVEWSLGIFLLSSPGRTINGKFVSRNINSYDKTLILDEAKLTERFYIKKGTLYTDAIEKLLILADIVKKDIQPSNIEIDLEREYPIGEKIKKIVDNLLEEINYNSIRADNLGVICSEPYVEPFTREVTQKYSSNLDSIIHPEINENLDLAGCSNVFIRMAQNIEKDREFISTYSYDDPSSQISTINLGRKIVSFESIDCITSQELLDIYTRRIAIESLQTSSHLSFSTALMPYHDYLDVLYLDISEILEYPMKFIETSWKMDLKYDGVMSHEARRIIKL